MNKNISLPKFSKGTLSSMKLPKGITTTHLVLMVVGVILLALTIYFAVSYFSAVNNKKVLNHNILQKQQQINAFGGLQNIAALQSQLESAQQDLIDKSPFPEEINNTDVASSIIQAAREASIACFQYTPQSPAILDINGNTYLSNSYSISSSGAGSTTGEKIIKLTNFLKELQDAYDTAKISGISLSDGDGDGLWAISFTYSILSLPPQ